MIDWLAQLNLACHVFMNFDRPGLARLTSQLLTYYFLFLIIYCMKIEKHCRILMLEILLPIMNVALK